MKKLLNQKEKNGTINHSEETKRKITNSLLALYQSDNPPVTVHQTISSNYRHLQGKVYGLFYRSSYEKKFIEYCVENSIKIESASNQEFRIPYYFDDKRKWYYPDFYLPDYDVVVEIKPISLLGEEVVQTKNHEACKKYKFSLVTEEELEDLDEYFLYLE